MKNHNGFLILLLSLVWCACGEGTDQVSPGAGLGGSMAQFTIHKGFLYVLNSDSLQTFCLENPVAPRQTSSSYIGFDAETIFPYNDQLFLGSQSGMHIYNITQLREPYFISSFYHITSCDPVVVEGNIAYVTLRDGSPCRGGASELQVVDISQVENPVLLASKSLMSPHGLAVHAGRAYVTNGEKGLAVFDVANPRAPVLLKEYLSYHGWDVISGPKSLVMVGDDGLVQYDVQDPADLKPLSVIPVLPSNP